MFGEGKVIINHLKYEHNPADFDRLEITTKLGEFDVSVTPEGELMVSRTTTQVTIVK